MKNLVVFDVGGTKIKHGVIDKEGNIICKGKYTTNCIEENIFIESMINEIEKYKKRFNIEGVGISFPGFIDIEKGIAVKAGAIDCMNGKDIKDIIESKVHLPVEIENDANCAALAELFSGNAVGCKDFICMTIGTGIGGGIVINGEILHGHANKAGEFGFMITIGDETKGKIMHEHSSTATLIYEYKRYKGSHEDEKIEGITVFEDAKIDNNVKDIINNWLRRISYGIFNLVATLNPEKVLIGGGVSSNEEFMQMIIEKYKEIDICEDIDTKIQPCKYTNDAGIIGARYHFINMQKRRKNILI